MAGTIVVDRIESDSSYTSTINVASNINFAGDVQLGGQNATYGYRNRIHNGDFRINQRGYTTRSNTLNNLSSSGGPSSESMAADRWNLYVLAQAVNGMPSSNVSVSTVGDHPLITSGNCFSITVNTNAAANANVVVANRTTDFAVLQYGMEGFDCADLFNTSNTTRTTLSFWVKSNKTGTYSIEVRPNPSPEVSKIILLPYTINQSGVWEKKTLTIPAYNLGNVPLDNAARLWLQFGLASNLKANHTDGTSTITQAGIDNITNQWGDNVWGSGVVITNHVNLFENTGNYWKITDIQFEASAVSTPFERRPYQQELALCQRYYQEHGYNGPIAQGQNTDRNSGGYVSFPVVMRTTPSTISKFYDVDIGDLNIAFTPLLYTDASGQGIGWRPYRNVATTVTRGDTMDILSNTGTAGGPRHPFSAEI